jgi:hypothetical protein
VHASLHLTANGLTAIQAKKLKARLSKSRARVAARRNMQREGKLKMADQSLVANGADQHGRSRQALAP